jgi:electron transfer flavoprotein alpha subunit
MMNDVVICLIGTYGFDRAAQGVTGAGQRLASELGGKLHALVVGPGDALVAELSKLVDGVHVADAAELAEYQSETYLAAMTGACRDLGARAILFGSDSYSQELVPRLAHRLGGSSLADGVALAASGETLQVTRSAYGGRAAAVYDLKRVPAVVWLRARGFEPATATASEAKVVQVTPELPAQTSVRIVERQVEEHDGVPLEEAQLVVSGGRGLGGPEPFEDLKKLAEVMGATVGASRVACDEGWVPPSWQIGQTGKKIAPELYLAVGISGAAQHILGITDAKVVAAINTDADAAIFKHASFGIVEDYKVVLPALTKRLAELKAGSS